MAFDATKKKPGAGGVDENPYQGLTGDTSMLSAAADGGDPGQASGSPMSGAAANPATPTGYTNFDSYFNANAGAADAAANNLSANVKGQVGTANKDLSTAQGQFTGAANAGTPAGPSGSDFMIATGNRMGFPAATANAKGPNQTSPYGTALKGVRSATQVQPGLDSTSTRNPGTGGTDENPYQPLTGAAPATDPAGRGPRQASVNPADATWQPGGDGGASNTAWQNSVLAGYAKAQGGYTGPESLQDTDAYGNLTKDTTNAQTAVDNLSTNGGIQAQQGGNQYDAALTSAAGRPQLANLQGEYGNGALGNRLDNAVTASQAQSAQDKQYAANSVSQYEALARAENGTQADLANKAAAPPIFTPTVGGETALNGDASDSTQGQNIQQLGVGPESGWNSFVAGRGTAGTDGTTPVFNAVSDKNNSGPSVTDTEGTINMPTGMGGAGADWGTFWGNAPGAPANGSKWNPTDLGLTSAQWQNLAQMSPAQRAAWWAKNGPKS